MAVLTSEDPMDAAAGVAPAVLAPPSAGFPWVTLADADPARLPRLVSACRADGVTYRLGAKASSGRPGVSFSAIDCSGFVGWGLCQITGGRLTALVGRGSVEQRDWVAARGFKESDVEAACLRDGALRVVYLDPHDTPGHVGHTALVWMGRTFESHGGCGPDSRAWTGDGWQQLCRAVYVLTAPTGQAE